jgi:hypothetical protein
LARREHGGEAGGGLYLHRAGPKVGKWVDAATCEFGDALDLVNATLFGGQDLPRAMEWARNWLRLDPQHSAPELPPRANQPKSHQHDGDEAAIAVARNLWRTARPITGTLGERYLRARAITFDPLPPTLCYNPALMHFPTGIALPALIAAISDADGKVTAVQRIYLCLDGSDKANVKDPKMTLGRMRNSACRLAPASPELGLTEGVETGLSAMELHGVPVWAACGSRLDAIAIPESVDRLIIFADDGEPGRRAAERAASVHKRTSRTVEIKLPPKPHKDWNDVERAAARAA